MERGPTGKRTVSGDLETFFLLEWIRQKRASYSIVYFLALEVRTHTTHSVLEQQKWLLIDMTLNFYKTDL